MICIYDSLIDPKATSFSRYGMTYKLDKRATKGDKTYYYFSAPGMEKLLVTADFAKQYYEAQKICNKFPAGKDIDFYLKSLKRSIDKNVSAEEYPSDSDSGTTYIFTAAYKDIQVQFEFDGTALSLTDQFVIVKGDIFGKGETVTMTKESED